MKNRFSFLALALFLATTFIGCGDDSNTAAGPTNPGGADVGSNSGNGASPSHVDVKITIMGVQGVNSFFPSTATVQRGQLIEWRNTDNQSHSLVSDTNAFDTGTINSGTTSSTLRISAPGAYHYHCVDHPHMVGSILVKP